MDYLGRCDLCVLLWFRLYGCNACVWCLVYVCVCVLFVCVCVCVCMCVRARATLEIWWRPYTYTTTCPLYRVQVLPKIDRESLIRKRGSTINQDTGMLPVCPNTHRQRKHEADGVHISWLCPPWNRTAGRYHVDRQ